MQFIFAVVGIFQRHLSQQQIADVYKRKGDSVYHRCKLILRNKDEAEDVMQEVFVNLMKYGGEFKDNDVPLAWLYRTAERCCYKRNKKYKDTTSFHDDLDALPWLDITSQFESSNMVARFLHILDRKHHPIAILYYIDGLSQERIAEQLGLTRKTVGRRLKKIKSLAAKMKKDSAPEKNGYKKDPIYSTW